MLFLWYRNVRSSFLCWKGKSNTLGRCVRVCVFFLLGPQLTRKRVGSGLLGRFRCLHYYRSYILKPDFYCWPNHINSVKLFTWEKIILTKLLKISSHGTLFIYLFFCWIKKIPRINYFSCWGNFLTGIKALGFLFVNCAEWVLHRWKEFVYMFWSRAGWQNKNVMWYNWQGIVMHPGCKQNIIVSLGAQGGSATPWVRIFVFLFCYNIFYFCNYLLPKS